MRRILAAFAALGAIWGLTAAGFHLLMFRGVVPGPAADPPGILRVIFDLPFIAGIGFEVVLGRGSPSFGEATFVSTLAGLALGAIVGAAIGAVRAARSE